MGPKSYLLAVDEVLHEKHLPDIVEQLLKFFSFFFLLNLFRIFYQKKQLFLKKKGVVED